MDRDVIQDILTTCEQSARAGARVLEQWQGRIRVREKAPADLVTQADIASQEEIRRKILEKFPDHDFLGEEESEVNTPGTSPFRWLVDPLDGTTNYVHGVPFFSVSVAVQYAGELLAGAVYHPALDECFRAARGCGATCNGSTIGASQVESLEDALVVTGFAPRTRGDSAEVQHFVKMLGRTQAVRRLGSAALNLCYVACGRLDAYWASSVKIWDVAAGVLIAQEAGATVAALNGAPLELESPRPLVTSTAPLQRAIIEVIGAA